MRIRLGAWNAPIADVMSRNRVEKLNKCLYLIDHLQVTDDKKDRLWKLRCWLLSLQRNLKQIEQEEMNVVDEMMVAFTGHLKQYVPNSPTPRGFKLLGRPSRRVYCTSFTYTRAIPRGGTPMFLVETHFPACVRSYHFT